MAAGLPIIAFDIAGVRELMAGEDQFALVPVEDVDELSRALSNVLANEELRRNLGSAARTLAVTEFDLKKYTARIAYVFREALRHGQSSEKETLSEIGEPASEINA